MRAQGAIEATLHAAARVGLDAAGYRVLRVGENVVLELPAAGVLVRVAPNVSRLDQVRHELAVAAWLDTQGIPVVQPWSPEPILADGLVVSFWEYVVDTRPADLATLARCLKQLHRVAIPGDGGPISIIDPFDNFGGRLRSSWFPAEDDRIFIRESANRAAAQWSALRFDLPPSVVHGDAHMDNLLIRRDGSAAFIDLEHVGIGWPEWDLTLTALYYECGWFTDTEYRQFVDVFGYDVRQAAAWPVLREIRMLRMVVWLAQTAGEIPERAVQLGHRIRTLRDGTAPSGWSGY